jgi:hypothetical protein
MIIVKNNYIMSEFKKKNDDLPDPVVETVNEFGRE